MFGGGEITEDLWHVPSTLVSLLLVGDPETEQWGPCKVSSCIPQEPHLNHTHLLWMTNSDQGRLLYFRHNYNRCFTTNKEKKKHQVAEYWHPSVLWQYPWRRTEKQVYNFTFWTQRSLSPLPSVCLELGSYLSMSSKRACFGFGAYTRFSFPASVCVRAFTRTSQRGANFIKFALLSPIRKCALPPAER